MKAYLCGLQDGADGAPLPEPDSLTPIEQVKFRLQELSDGFNEQLRTMVGMITDLDQEEQDSVVDENPEDVEDSELDPSDQDSSNVQNDEAGPDSDAESAYTYSGLQLLGRASTINPTMSCFSTVAKGVKGSMNNSLPVWQQLWGLDDMIDQLQSHWSNEFHEANSCWTDLTLPLLRAVTELAIKKELTIPHDEVQQILMLSAFVHLGTEAPMCELLHCLFAPGRH